MRIDRDLERSNLATQATARDAEHAGRFRLVAIADAQDARDHVTFHELERFRVQVAGIGFEPFIDKVPQIRALVAAATGATAGRSRKANAVGNENRE